MRRGQILPQQRLRVAVRVVVLAQEMIVRPLRVGACGDVQVRETLMWFVFADNIADGVFGNVAKDRPAICELTERGSEQRGSLC